MTDFTPAGPGRSKPPFWTEWSQFPANKSRSREVFDEIMTSLKRSGLVDTKSNLFVHLAKYVFTISKNGQVGVKDFLESVPPSIFATTSPSLRYGEIEGLVQLLSEAQLARILAQDGDRILAFELLERQDEKAKTKNLAQANTNQYLHRFYGRSDFRRMVSGKISFPTWESLELWSRNEGVQIIQRTELAFFEDRPDTNETNPNPFLQQTLRNCEAPFCQVSFWPLPEVRSAERSAAGNPGLSAGGGEFAIILPTDTDLGSFVKTFCLPLVYDFLSADENREIQSELQMRFTTYLRQYNERLLAQGARGGARMPSERMERILTTSDPASDVFANTIYLLCQFFSAIKLKNLTNTKYQNFLDNPVVFQAARIAYAYAMALRVLKRQSQKADTDRVQDSKILVEKLQITPAPLTPEDLARVKDVTAKTEIGKKYKSLVELLPLTPAEEGQPPEVFDLGGTYLHRESLLLYFNEIRHKEVQLQKEILAELWSKAGAPRARDMKLPENKITTDFKKITELIQRYRALAQDGLEFARFFLPTGTSPAALLTLNRGLAPDSKNLLTSPYDLITRGLDPLIYADRDKTQNAGYLQILKLQDHYQDILRESWGLVFQREGVFSFIIKRILGFFRTGPGGGKVKKPKAAGSGASGSPGGSSAKVMGGGTSSKVMGPPGSAGPSPAAARQAQLKKLISVAPLAGDKAALEKELKVTLDQWCFKIDKRQQLWTQQAVDEEVRRFVGPLAMEQLSEENSVKLALQMVKENKTLAQVTSSRAYHRYLYLTALKLKAQKLEGRGHG